MMHFNQDLSCDASVLPTDLEFATIDSSGNRLILTGHSPGELLSGSTPPHQDRTSLAEEIKKQDESMKWALQNLFVTTTAQP
jgi:hypothetical protein